MDICIKILKRQNSVFPILRYCIKKLNYNRLSELNLKNHKKTGNFLKFLKKLEI